MSKFKMWSKSILYHCNKLILRFRFSVSRQILHFCMCNFVPADKANRALSAKTKLHIQNCKTYDGLENIENSSRALEVTLSSSTDTNLGHNHTKKFKNVWGKFRYFRIAFSREVVGLDHF